MSKDGINQTINSALYHRNYLLSLALIGMSLALANILQYYGVKLFFKEE